MKPPEALDELIRELRRLPGVGEKTASRLAHFIVRMDREVAEGIARAILEAKNRIQTCRVCFNVSEENPCRICSGEDRDPSIVCVVEEPLDLLAIERSGSFRGRYHVLQGTLSPLEGIRPEDLRIEELAERLRGGVVQEAILALNPTIEGEATALYLTKLLKPLSVRVTRIASGVPMGADLEYIDRVTLTRAIENRREL